MANLSPEQMRELADAVDGAQSWSLEYSVVRVGQALRTAADQLEAVNEILDERWEEDHSDAYYLDLHTDAENRIRRVLTADTAPGA